MKQLHTGEGLEGAQLARRSGEVLGDEKAICGRNTGAVHTVNVVGKLQLPGQAAVSPPVGKVRPTKDDPRNLWELKPGGQKAHNGWKLQLIMKMLKQK